MVGTAWSTTMSSSPPPRKSLMRSRRSSRSQRYISAASNDPTALLKVAAGETCSTSTSCSICESGCRRSFTSTRDSSLTTSASRAGRQVLSTYDSSCDPGSTSPRAATPSTNGFRKTHRALQRLYSGAARIGCRQARSRSMRARGRTSPSASKLDTTRPRKIFSFKVKS